MNIIGASAFAGCTGLTSVVNNGTLNTSYTLPTKSGYHWEFNGCTVTYISLGVEGQGTYTLVAN